jgi:hypothetical protein
MTDGGVDGTYKSVDWWLTDTDGGSELVVHAKWPLPLWDGNTIKAKILWTNGEASGSGDAVFEVALGAIKDNVTIDAAYGTGVNITDTFLSDGTAHLTPASTAITPAGSAATDATTIMCIKVTHKAQAAGNTYTKKCRFGGIVLEYGITNQSSW